MVQKRLGLDSFTHYVFNAGENKGEPLTHLTKNELSKTLNVEYRSRGLSTRFGSSILNLSSNLPNPIDTARAINSGYGFTFGDSNLSIFALNTFLYKDHDNPSQIATGLTANLKFQFSQVASILYCTNGTDNVRFFQPSRSSTSTYTAGYATPSAFTVADNGVGLLGAGTYEYYVTLYDSQTRTESNRQAVVVSITVGALRKVLLSGLPTDSESRTTHWRIYRKDPSGYYHYNLAEIPYNASDLTYLDNAAATGTTRVAPNDNDRPDPSKTMCKHNKLMVYGNGNQIMWSKNYRYQNVPSYNLEVLEEESSEITKSVSFDKGILIIFKSRSIYAIIGDLNTGKYDVHQFSKSVGTVSPDTVCVHSNGIFFFGSDGKPHFVTKSDFQADDLRESTDISYKYRQKFENLNASQYPNYHAVLFNYKGWTQYRLFVQVDTPTTYCNYCYVYDYGLQQRNGGDSAWFTFRYNINAKCSWVSRTSGEVQRIIIGDDYTLLWGLDVENQYFDGDDFQRVESSGTVTYGTNTITISNASMTSSAFVGMQVVVYNNNSFDEVFRSKVTANTSTQFTVQDTLPTMPSNAYITVGGYLTYFATADFHRNRAGRCRPMIMSVLLSQDVGEYDLYLFTHYDFNELFNYTYTYMNSTTNTSRSSRSDIYRVTVGSSLAVYDEAIYDTARYGYHLFDTSEFLLNNTYLFNHVNWGIVTREPNRPFIYLGASMYHTFKGLLNPQASGL